MPDGPYIGHAPESSGKLRGENGENLAPADAGVDGAAAVAAYFDDGTAIGASAYKQGWPRHDGGPASSGHFGPS